MLILLPSMLVHNTSIPPQYMEVIYSFMG